MIFSVFLYVLRICFFIFFPNTCSITISPNAGTENKIGVDFLPQMPNQGKKVGVDFLPQMPNDLM
jgi:hypothetical protein